jgi:hypothetical protein
MRAAIDKLPSKNTEKKTGGIEEKMMTSRYPAADWLAATATRLFFRGLFFSSSKYISFVHERFQSFWLQCASLNHDPSLTNGAYTDLNSRGTHKTFSAARDKGPPTKIVTGGHSNNENTSSAWEGKLQLTGQVDQSQVRPTCDASRSFNCRSTWTVY